MNRLDKIKNNKKSIAIYIMAGDPDLNTTEEIIYLLYKEGVSIIELGFPFSDPIADGPVIQKASERALKNKITLENIFNLVKKVRTKVDIPIVIMTYYNVIFKYGKEKFINKSKLSGIDGAIIPDLPFDEENDFFKTANNNNFYIINLVAPTSSLERIKNIIKNTKGFIYFILLKGVTGERKKINTNFKLLQFIRKNSKIPVLAGFGISKKEHAKKILKYADGIIIGSKIVSLIEKYSRKKYLLHGKIKKIIREFVNEVENARR